MTGLLDDILSKSLDAQQMQSQILELCQHFGAWPIELLNPDTQASLRVFYANKEVREFLPGWICAYKEAPSLHQLRHYYWSARFFWTLERAGWLNSFEGEKIIRANKASSHLPDGKAVIFDGDGERKLVIEVMVTRREFAINTVAKILKAGEWPVFVVVGAGKQATENLKNRVGPLSAVITDKQLVDGTWQIALRAPWI